MGEKLVDWIAGHKIFKHIKISLHITVTRGHIYVYTFLLH